ncbi:MAG TPA: tyrosine-type recombinase/integrase [Chloroflexia bacterium]|nr:tyrosine-type recombinase/integrase [Chloroflexia bacterium]
MPTKYQIEAKKTRVEVSEEFTSFTHSFERYLRAANKSEQTITVYMGSLNQLGQFLAKNGMPQDVLYITREHLESFFTHLLKTMKPSSVETRYRSIHVFFSWLENEDEIEKNPFDKMRSPTVPQNPPPVLTEEQIKALLKACEGKEYEDRRDMAMIRLFLDTGLRLSELMNIKVSEVDFKNNAIEVIQKGRTRKIVFFGNKTAAALDRYIRIRKSHKDQKEDRLWLGQMGPLRRVAIARIVKLRGDQAGIKNLHPHLLRHTFANEALKSGMNEGDVMTQGGWRNRVVMSRYAASAAVERSKLAMKTHSPSDKY